VRRKQPMDSTRGISGAPQERLISGRYRIERVLVSRGTVTVFQALDEVVGRPVALKRPREARPDPHTRALLQREYYTLANLRHPSIVQAYDFGVDVEGPYYTTELLAGQDLRASAPVAWPAVCRMLHDIARALSALHTRRLLHRDLRPQNLWLTPDGWLKLIDFGALCPFGVAADVAGAAPMVPPEALYAQPLDERSDLYGVGVLAYWLLTGDYPYPAQHVSDLPRAWQRPPPSVAAAVAGLGRDLPPVPAKLDALIAALLHHDPLGRPAHTAALVDRLEALGDVSGVAHERAASRRLPRSGFVGRASALQRLREALDHSDERHGSCAMYTSAAGMGRTRLLRELALIARLKGAHVLEVHATQHTGSYGVAEALALALLDALPETAARAALPHAPGLAHLSHRVRARVEGPAVQPADLGDTGESRLRVQAALYAWFLDVAREHSLVILVDDLHCVDDPSAAWLARLAGASGQHRLLMAATLLDEHTQLPPSAAMFRAHAIVSTLDALTLHELERVLRSIFGDVPHLPRLAARLRDVTRGCPAHALELADHLVRSGAITYAHGSWHIPSDVSVTRLPATRDDCMLERLESLPASARALGQVLSIQAGCFSLEACTSLFETEDKPGFDDLEALVREEVLTNTPEGLEFAHPRLRAHLLGELAEPRCSAAHARLGAWLLSDPHATALERLHAGVHLMRGGDAQGAEVITQAALQLREADSLGDAAPVLGEAVEQFKRAGYERHELVTLLARVVLASSYGDPRFSDRYGDEMLELLVDVLGLRTARRLRPLLGRKLSLLFGVALAAFAFSRRRENPLVPSFQVAMLLLFGATAGLATLRAARVDPKGTARCADVLQPLTALGRDHVASLVHAFCAAVAQTHRDRSSLTHQHWQRMLERLHDAQSRRDLGPDSHRRYLAATLYALGAHEALRDGSNALWYAQQLEALDDTAFAMQADQIHWMYHACRGEPALSEHYQRRIEAQAIARGSAWQVETWAACVAIPLHERTDDALGMQRTLDTLTRLHQTMPSLRTFVERARGVNALLRGDHREAARVLSRAIETEPPELVGSTHTHGALARAYNRLGDHARARTVCLKALDRLVPDDLECTALNLVAPVQLALADAALGESDDAARHLDALITHHAPHQNPLTLGALHEARARVALLQDDLTAFEDHLRRARTWYLPTAIPTLLQRCDNLARERRSRPRPLPARPLARRLVGLAVERGPAAREVGAARVRADATLCALAASADSDEAYLFEGDAAGLSLTAKTGGDAVPPELTWWVTECLRRGTPSRAQLATCSNSIDTLALKSKSYRLVRLYTPWPSGHRVLGAAVLATHRGFASAPDEHALSELEAQLWKAQEHQRSAAR